MSGNIGKNMGSGAALGMLAGLALAPVTGGASLGMAAAMGASGGAFAGGVKDALVDKPREALKDLKNSFIGNSKKKNLEVPAIDNEEIKRARASRFYDLQKRTGRSSTLLTNQNPSQSSSANTSNTFG